MRIVILADPIDNQYAGIHVYTREMVNALIRNNPGHDIILIREQQDPSLSGVQQIALRNIRLPIGYASLRLFLLVPRLIRRLKADIVIEPAHFGPFNLPARIRRVTVIHDLTPILFPELHRWHSQVLQRIFLKGILNKTDLIITNSENTSRDLCTVYPPNCSKVRRIYPGITDGFKPDHRPQVLEKYGISSPYFLNVGTIEPRKNLNILLESFATFMDQTGADCNLVITGGTGWKAEPFFEALDKHTYREKIILTSYVDAADLNALYSQAQAFIYPSVYEGFGLPVVEAMKCGCPVIASQRSSLPEAGGTAALYFDPEDANALAGLMVRLVTEEGLRDQLSQRSLAHAATFSWDDFGRELWRALLELKEKP